MTARRTGPRKPRSDDVWEKPKIRALLAEEPGAPIKLTRAEAMAIAEASFGARPDLPKGSDYVRRLDHHWRGLLRDRRGRRSS